jgi:hypothetical protein
VTELPRYVGRHASADDAKPPTDGQATADEDSDADESTSSEPSASQDGPDGETGDEETAFMERFEGKRVRPPAPPSTGEPIDPDKPAMPEWWRSSQEPPRRQQPWTGPSVGAAPPLEPALPPPDPELDEPGIPESVDAAEDAAEAEDAADAEESESDATESDAATPDPVSAGTERSWPGPSSADPTPADPTPADPTPSDLAPLVPGPVPVPPVPTSELQPDPEPEPEPALEPEPDRETVPRFRLSMAPRPRSEAPSDDDSGLEPESEPAPEPAESSHQSAQPEREVDPQVYSFAEESYSDEPPEPGLADSVAAKSELDSHGLARLSLMNAVDAIWPGGTPDLTTWLADNLDLLEDPLGFALSPHHQVAWMPTRSAVRGLGGGTEPLDIPGNLVASDRSGAPVMVRAQVAAADTDGLGALLAAAAIAQAQTAVWVCPRINEGLRQTLRWIGGDPSANVRLYGLEMYLVKIAGSPTAPLFDAVVSPGSP